MKRRFFTHFQKDNSPAFAGIASGLFVLCIVLIGIYLQLKIIIQDNYIAAVQDLSIVRAKLESDFNSRLLLSKGLVSYVKVNPDIQSDEFHTFTASLIGQDPLVRNVSLIKKHNDYLCLSAHRQSSCHWPRPEQNRQSAGNPVQSHLQPPAGDHRHCPACPGRAGNNLSHPNFYRRRPRRCFR